MTIKKGRRISAFVLAAALLFSAVVLPKVHAAVGVDTKKMCVLEIDLRECGFNELSGVSALPVKVNLYKVADIDVSGNYTAVSSLEDLNADFAGIDATTTAEEWRVWALKAKTEIEANETAVTASGTTEYGIAVIDSLETGLYLVDARQVESSDYTYDFTPFLISMPNNYYYSTGDDTWVYDLTGDNAVSLKTARTDRLGDLVIHKSLDVYNETIGGATFVFRIEAVKTDVDAKEDAADRTKVVYSDVVSMTFTGPGTDSIIIKDLPAGAEVTVTEVYSGASYKVTTDASVTKEILAETAVDITFENTYDSRLNGGSGIVNSFTYDSETKGWIPSQAEDSTP